MKHEHSQPSPAVSELAHAIFDYAAQTAADDAVDDAFLRPAGLDHRPTARVHQDLLALYLYGLLVLVNPAATGMKQLSEDDQSALLTAVWTCYYDLHLSLGALTPEQIHAKTEALGSVCKGMIALRHDPATTT